MISIKNLIFDKSLIGFTWNTINFHLKNTKILFFKSEENKVYVKYSLEGYWINCVFGITNNEDGWQNTILQACDFLFNKYTNVRKITVCIWQDDIDGMNHLSNMGFEQEVVIRDYITINKVKYSMVIMSIFKEGI